MDWKWQSNFTGELFENLPKAIWAAISDMKHYPKYRTIKAFSFSRVE